MTVPSIMELIVQGEETVFKVALKLVDFPAFALVALKLPPRAKDGLQRKGLIKERVHNEKAADKRNAYFPKNLRSNQENGAFML